MAEPPLRFAGMLRQLRAEAALTQEELAEAAGLNPRTISDLERGLATTPHKDTVRLLADALQLGGSARVEFEAAARGHAGPHRPRADGRPSTAVAGGRGSNRRIRPIARLSNGWREVWCASGSTVAGPSRRCLKFPKCAMAAPISVPGRSRGCLRFLICATGFPVWGVRGGRRMKAGYPSRSRRLAATARPWWRWCSRRLMFRTDGVGCRRRSIGWRRRCGR